MKVSIYKNCQNKFFLISITSFFLSGLFYQPVKAGTELPEFCTSEESEALTARCEELKLKILDEAEAATKANIATSEKTEATSGIVLPEPTTFGEGAKPLSGDITVPKESEALQETMESKILAYQAIDKITGDICRSIDSKIEENSHLVILDDETINAIPSYLILNSRKELYKKAYDDLFKEAEAELRSEESETTSSQTDRNKSGIDAGPLALPGAVARTIIEFSSLFKTEQTINNSKFTIASEPIVSSLASKCTKSKIYYPNVYLLDIQNKKSSVETFWGDLKFLLDSLQIATSYILEFENKDVETLTDNQKLIAEKLKKQNEAVIAFFDELKTANEQKQNALYLMAKAKTVHENLLKDKNAYMLQISNVEGGGSFNTTKSLFSSNIKFSGGSIVRYFLFNRDSSILSSGTTYYLTPRTKIDSDTPLTNISESE